VSSSYISKFKIFLLEEKLGGEGRHPFTQIAPMVLCSDMSHLDNYFQNVVENGGEGIILRDPQSLLIPGRSPGFLKHKVLLLTSLGS